MAVNVLSCIYGNCVIPQRYILCLMTFIGIVVSYSMRVCLHIAITKMVVPIVANRTNVEGAEVCPERSHDIKIPDGGKLNWTEDQQGMVLAAFFPGYVMTQVPGGMISDIFGGKHIFSAGIALSAILTFLTPVTVELGSWWALTIVRCIIGLVQGPLFPSMSTLLARWVPPRERGRLVTLVTSGAQIGAVTGNLFSSLIMVYAGWITVFYFWGVISLVWYILFLILCYSVPAQNPYITDEEAAMLATEIGTSTKFKIPWKEITLDLPIWGLVFAEIGHDLLFFLAVVELPKYMSDVLKFNIKENGLLNAIPYLALTLFSFLSGVLADWIINTNRMTVLNTRRWFTTVGKVGPGIFIVLISYVGCDSFAVGIMFVLCMIAMGPFYVGMRVNAYDISINFAGVIMGIINGLGAVAFIPVPNIIAAVTSNYTLDEWRTVFWAMFVLSVVTDIIYVIWASAERAEWDKNPSEL